MDRMKKVLWLGLILLLLAIQAAPVNARGCVATIDGRGLKLMLKLDPNLVIIDVRSSKDCKAAALHLPGEVNIPLEKLRARPELLDRFQNRTIVFVAKAEADARSAAAIAARKKALVYVFTGSFRELQCLSGKAAGGNQGGERVAPAGSRKPAPQPSAPPENGGDQDEEDFGC